jgi:hypothetical protein
MDVLVSHVVSNHFQSFNHPAIFTQVKHVDPEFLGLAIDNYLGDQFLLISCYFVLWQVLDDADRGIFADLQSKGARPPDHSYC